MRKKLNLNQNSTLLELQNMWFAFDRDRNIIAHAKNYLSLHKLIPNNMRGKVQSTFINTSTAFLAPYNGSL